MSYKCEIVADSVMPQGHRLTTYLITYPRIIHAEMMTHRMFSRNASSCLTGDTRITVEKPSLLLKGQRCSHNNMTIKEICKNGLMVIAKEEI